MHSSARDRPSPGRVQAPPRRDHPSRRRPTNAAAPPPPPSGIVSPPPPPGALSSAPPHSTPPHPSAPDGGPGGADAAARASSSASSAAAARLVGRVEKKNRTLQLQRVLAAKTPADPDLCRDALPLPPSRPTWSTAVSSEWLREEILARHVISIEVRRPSRRAAAARGVAAGRRGRLRGRRDVLHELAVAQRARLVLELGELAPAPAAPPPRRRRPREPRAGVVAQRLVPTDARNDRERR